MAEDERQEPIYNFFLSTFGFAMIAFPLVATVNTTYFSGELGGGMLSVICLVFAIPPALEFAFSRRDPVRIGKYVITFLVIYFLVIVVQAAFFVSIGASEPIPAVQFSLLFVTYVITYVLVYRGGIDSLKRGLTSGG